MSRTNVIAVTGANSGLGEAICTALRKDQLTNRVIPIYGPEEEGGTDLTQGTLRANDLIRDHHFSEVGNTEPHRILINCAGVNNISWFKDMSSTDWDRLMDLNAKAGVFLTQKLLFSRGESWFRGGGTVLNIVSNASHVPMTNSVAYNASKAAFHMATMAMARELRKTHNLTVFGISPNKLSGTGMSDYIEATVPAMRGWTPEEAAAYQLAALPAGEETDPKQLAEFIAHLLSTPENHKYLTGTVLPYGA